LKGVFENGAQNYQFEASGVQTLILYLFNTKKEVTFNHIKGLTGMNEEYLNPALSILTAGGPDAAVLVKV
jgi:hypothetical protein